MDSDEMPGGEMPRAIIPAFLLALGAAASFRERRFYTSAY
jgi:hypothetical protein